MEKQKTIGVFTPALQGFYFGELVSQLQQFCFLKGYNFTVIKTDGYGSYCSLMHCHHIDYVVILRNAISNSFAQQLLDMGKPIVAIAYDYFPLSIPVISSDNELGTELAFNFLLQKGHRNFAFVGDLSQYDIRKRYEAFCDQCEINQIETNENNLFVVNDMLFSGGYQAAKEFIDRKSSAKAIICGASLTCIGFSQQLKLLIDNHNELDIVGFDAISLIPLTEPSITMVDQNLHLMVYKAIGILENISAGEHVERHNAVEPKLISHNSDFMKSEDAFLATSTEIAELHNANYMKSVLCSLEEWPKTIADTRLDSLMMLAPLFSKYLHEACYGRTAISKDGREYIKVVKKITRTSVKNYTTNDLTTLTESADYPSKCADIQKNDLDISIHLPIFKGERLWSSLSIFGSNSRPHTLSSFSALSAYLDNIVKNIKLELYKNQTPAEQIRTQNAQTSVQALTGLITWSPDKNETQWDNAALIAIGLSSDLEQNIYRHLDLTDRIHPEDDSKLRQCLLCSHDESFGITAKLKNKNRSYTAFKIERESIEKNGDVIIRITQAESAE